MKGKFDPSNPVHRQEFANSLTFFRSICEMTQQELGRLVGVTSSQISRYEAGLAVPRKAVMMRLCKALNVDEQTLLSGSEMKELIQVKMDPELVEQAERLAAEEGLEVPEFLAALLRDSLRKR